MSMTVADNIFLLTHGHTDVRTYLSTGRQVGRLIETRQRQRQQKINQRRNILVCIGPRTHCCCCNAGAGNGNSSEGG